MIQQVMTAPGQIEFRTLPVPEPKEGEVLLRMMRIGVCGSDIHVYHGKHPFTAYPVVQGHEVSAEIVEVGDGVEGLAAGMKVTVQPQVICGKCHPCRHGKYNLCENLKVMGFQTEGLAAEYCAVSAERVTPLAEGMTHDQGAMIEPLAVAVHAAGRAGDIRGCDVAVIGAGPIGNLVAQTAKGMGAGRVLITDISEYRLALARECGIDTCVNSREVSLGDAMRQAFGPDKADVIFDCAGNDDTIGAAIQYARKGSTIILVAVFSEMARVDLAVLNDHELDLNTSMMYRNEDYLQAIRLVSERKVSLEKLVSKHFAFAEYLAAYQYIEENRETTMKVLIDVQT